MENYSKTIFLKFFFISQHLALQKHVYKDSYISDYFQ